MDAIENTVVPNTSSRLGDNISFDYDNLAETYNNDGIQIFVANQYGFSNNNIVNYADCFFLENGVIKDRMIIGTENKSTDLKIIHHYELNWDEFLAIQLDNRDQSITRILGVERHTQCTGANVMACISDAYSDHGWVSVWAFVQTAFLPQTAAAIGVMCAIKNHC